MQIFEKYLEKIMNGYGDSILKISHKYNLTYSRGIGFVRLLEIIEKNGDL